MATKFVIRSMSTTDYRPAYRRGDYFEPAQQPKPYHIFLKEAGKRHGAYWASYGDIARFETAEEAEAEAKRANVTGYDIVPQDFAAQGLPNCWDARK